MKAATMTNMRYMDQISIDIKTIDWTEGDHSCLSLMIANGKSATIAWGDGRKQTVYGRQDYLNGGLVWTSIDHYYAHKGYCYTIDIQGDNGSIIGFSGMAMFEQSTFRVDVSRCPLLEIFEYSTCGPFTLDVSHNPKLKKIEAVEIGNERLDFSPNPLLEDLSLRDSKSLVSLKLSKNDRLKKLSVFLCHKLRHIALSNSSSLNWVDLQGTHLHPRDKEYLIKTLERNEPYHIEEDDDYWEE